MVIGVNLTTAIYNLIPVPPLAMGLAGLRIAARRTQDQHQVAAFSWPAPILILALALLERLTHQGIFSPYFDPLIRAIYTLSRRS